jgi:hypothetical protein
MKINRQSVYDKFGGRCAYCGTAIEFKKMQVDHYWPQFLAHQQPDLDNNRFENLMPSCHRCNNHKHGMRPETWRSELERHSDMLQANTQFQRALRFGQVAVTKTPVLFHFEKIKDAPQNIAETVYTSYNTGSTQAGGTGQRTCLSTL